MSATGNLGKSLLVGTMALGLVAHPAFGHPAKWASIASVEGVVQAVERASGDAREDLVAIHLQLDQPAPREIHVGLAPRDVLRQAGFDIGAGDRVRARIFLPEDGTAEAHEVTNISHGSTIRLRTLSGVPLWDSAGKWQGGACRRWYGGRGPGPGRDGCRRAHLSAEPSGGRGGRR